MAALLRSLVLLQTETILILSDWNFYYEDSNTKMILHSINAGQRGAKQLLVFAQDIDVSWVRR